MTVIRRLSLRGTPDNTEAFFLVFIPPPDRIIKSIVPISLFRVSFCLFSVLEVEVATTDKGNEGDETAHDYKTHSLKVLMVIIIPSVSKYSPRPVRSQIKPCQESCRNRGDADDIHCPGLHLSEDGGKDYGGGDILGYVHEPFSELLAHEILC